MEVGFDEEVVDSAVRFTTLSPFACDVAVPFADAGFPFVIDIFAVSLGRRSSANSTGS